VSIRVGTLAVAGVMTTGLAATALAVDKMPDGVSVAKDLTAVIALQGLPCGNVVSATPQGNDNYVAACENGKRYRVFVDADGRVVVEKLD
jgi:hypothetical protein